MTIKRSTDKHDYELFYSANGNTNKTIVSTFAVQRLYEEVRHSKILSLKISYEDLSVLNGDNTVLVIHAARKTKVINMRNSQPEELNGVLSILAEFELAIR
ncbi:MAG: hypothetical protein EBU52_08270 [Cytophagia bacterium]|nr:hypothetical protein [Cytophagia bacterium]